MKIILIIVLVLIGLVATFFAFIKTMGWLWDKWAAGAAKKYCVKNGLTFKEVKPFPNHYGLYFLKDGKNYYASFDYERDRSINWKKGSPLDKIQKTGN